MKLPHYLTSADAVETQVRLLGDSDDTTCASCVGIIVRRVIVPSLGNAEDKEQCPPTYFIKADTTKHGPTSFRDQDWHTLRAQAEASHFRLLIDGTEVVSLDLADITDDDKMASGTVGITVDGLPIAIRQFRVIKLGVSPP